MPSARMMTSILSTSGGGVGNNSLLLFDRLICTSVVHLTVVSTLHSALITAHR